MSILSLPPRIAPPALDGLRLDQALAALFPELAALGRRQRTRFLETCEARVDERPRAKGYRVAAGQLLEVRGTSTATGAEITPPLRVVAVSDLFAAIYKPSGMHTARIVGKPAARSATSSLEALLPALFPEANAQPLLLNRLDFPTSGLVLAGFGPSSRARYKELEVAGLVEKIYVLMVRGRLDRELVCSNALDTARRATTRVLETQSEDPLRRTRLVPLRYFATDGPFEDVTLVRATINKGARHQIRAHCGHAGHPIMGDGRYGDQKADAHAGRTPARISLHHARIVFPDFAAACAPEWDPRLLAYIEGEEGASRPD